MPNHLIERLTETRIYRLCRSLLVTLAALYIAMVAVNAAQYRGANAGVFGFALGTLKADMIDVLSVISYKLFDYGLGTGSRPTRYALICEETGQATEADNAATERQVRAQLVDNKSGNTYNNMIAAMNSGNAHPVFILSKNALGGGRLCAASRYSRQECTCSGIYKATERSRILASDLFGPRKPLN